jgi:hypothetical protein
MYRSIVRQLSRVGSLVVGAMLGLGGMAALAETAPAADDCWAIQFEMANPSPGSRVDPGKYVLQGTALDTRAEDGRGIDRVDFFLGNRDTGGVILGHAVPSDLGPFAATSFETIITLPNQVGGQELFGYAHSAITGQESILSVPIAVGMEPSKAGDLMARPALATCTPSVEAAPPPAAMDETLLATELPSMAPLAAQAETTDDTLPAEMGAPDELPAPSQMFFDVGNPSAGDSIHVGRYMIEGIAFDRAADQSPGIERIDVFLDDRDAGGTIIGHGMLGAPSPVPDDPALAGSGWTAQVTLTSRMTGPHTLFFYAQSGVTGEELVVAIPVQVMP